MLQKDVAEFTGLIAESIFYGIYLLLVGFSARLLASRVNRGRSLNYVMMIVASLMFLIVNGQIVSDTWNMAFAFFHRDTRAERLVFLKDNSQALAATRHSMFMASVIVADSFMAYRAFIVWGRRWYVAVLPLALEAVAFACAVLYIWSTRSGAQVIFKHLYQYVATMFASTLCSNGVSTAFIAFRIWQVDRETNVLGVMQSDSALAPVMWIVIESGALNAAYLFAYLMTAVTGTQGLEIMAEMATVVIGINMTLLMIRVQINAEREARYTLGLGKSTNLSTFEAAGPKVDAPGKARDLDLKSVELRSMQFNGPSMHSQYSSDVTTIYRG